MAKKSKRLRFPTSDKDALKLFRLLADVSDLADGDDDLDEGDALTRSWLRDVLGVGLTPDAATLARMADGDDDLTALAAAAPRPLPDGTFASMADAEPRLTWQRVAQALKIAEDAAPISTPTVTQALASLGLSRAPEFEPKAGCLAFRRDTQLVGVRLYQLGSIRVAEIAVSTTSKGAKGGRGPRGAGGRQRVDERSDPQRPFADGPLTADDLEEARLVPGAAGTYVAGSVVGQAAWEEIVDAFSDTLERAQTALRAAGKGDAVPRLPVAFDTLKAFVAEGKDAADRAEDDAELAEIGRLQGEIRDAWVQLHRERRAPKGVVLQFDGPDGAGKTSSSKYIPAALMAANEALAELPEFAGRSTPVWTTRTEVFKAPTDADKAAMAAGAGAEFDLPVWLARHVTRGMPAEREILIKDRYQPGDYVYVGEHTEARCAQMAADNARYEAVLADRKVLVFQAILYADRDKQAKTFGKRMARGALVDALVSELRRRETLTAAAETELQAVKDKVQNADFVGLARFDAVLPLYRQFAAAVGAPVLDATDRHAARLALLERFLVVTKGFGEG